MLKKLIHKRTESYYYDFYKILNFKHLFKIRKFNYKKLKNTVAEYSYKKIYFSWLNNGASDALVNHLEFLETSDAAWITEVKSVWLIYISCLLQRGNKAEALRILHKYLYCFDKTNIPYFLPVANLAYENGISDKKIELASNLFMHFEQQQKENSFEEKVLNAKSIAIVGNSPNELGKKKGKEIDAHDLVIRLNKFQTEGFEQDYGSKVDIWSKVFSCLYLPPSAYPQTKPLNVILYNYWNMNFQIHLFNPKSIADYPLCFSTVETYKKINSVVTPAIPLPTTGYYTILWVYSLLKNFDHVDLYGFSILDGNLNNYSHYYNKNEVNNNCYPQGEDRIAMHNIAQEYINLKKIYHKETR